MVRAFSISFILCLTSVNASIGSTADTAVLDRPSTNASSRLVARVENELTRLINFLNEFDEAKGRFSESQRALLFAFNSRVQRQLRVAKIQSEAGALLSDRERELVFLQRCDQLSVQLKQLHRAVVFNEPTNTHVREVLRAARDALNSLTTKDSI